MTERILTLDKQTYGGYRGLKLWKSKSGECIVAQVPRTCEERSSKKARHHEDHLLIEVGDIVTTINGSRSFDDIVKKDVLFRSSSTITVTLQTNQLLTWREKSIAAFDLKPVPDAWRNEVREYSDSKWENYFSFRVYNEFISKRQETEIEYQGFLDKEWIEVMADRIEELMENKDCQWQWTPMISDVVYDDDSIRTCDYLGFVWSPFEIPACIALNHYFHNRARYSTVEYWTNWKYYVPDFNSLKVDLEDEDFTELCSCVVDDENHHAGFIVNNSLHSYIVDKMRQHLYGTNNEVCKSATCSDKNFLFLLFGSMGTTDPELKEDPLRCDLGYVWKPYFDEKQRKEMFDSRVPVNDNPDSTFPQSIHDYEPEECSWLYYAVLKASRSLGPFTKHYKYVQDTHCYSEDEEEGDYSDYDSEGRSNLYYY
ncbi:hypothetical protein CTEN210_00670 [Chaetoceros tenuissimus]|uniref:Uncharacterized protein n=1 Tax=Chaetoceros tenuissimus TaxID=426638 RepID=A0AAD3CG55_9STRA|nr:hypothetical protein CTEN210_00670 [Chaetoceros tenuissimus]